MSNLRQAAQQALEALERYRIETPLGHQPHMIAEEADSAITALKQALAEPEQEPFMVVAPECAERGCMAHDDRVDGSGVVVQRRKEQEPQTTHWEGCEAVHPECKEKANDQR